mmetsp:Transcript_5533/g.11739  ORF Transcript_5533/g.11739 Transcript_5533/m.11739 type:complete len:89 (-) Transcript_5533:275-541(-)
MGFPRIPVPVHGVLGHGMLQDRLRKVGRTLSILGRQGGGTKANERERGGDTRGIWQLIFASWRALQRRLRRGSREKSLTLICCSCWEW